MSDSDSSERESRQESMWADCAECGSGNTSIGWVEDDDPIICNDCDAETEGINKVGGWDD